MIALTRFERKIVAAIASVAIVPLVGALLLGREALQEAYEIGVNPRVDAQLERGLEMHRAHLVALRRDAERTTDAIANDLRLHDADLTVRRAFLDEVLDRYDEVARVRASNADAEPIQVERTERLDESEFRLLTLDRELRGIDVEVTIATPRDLFEEYERAGEIREVYARLRSSAGYVSGFYVGTYATLLLSVIVASLAVGIILSRRVTRRVADLAEATARVGAGDLSVVVPTDANDEVGELTRSFNAMVRDIRESRERIVYLQRMSAWQDFARRLAHEIKNPLTPIQLAVQEAHKSYDGDDARYRRILDETRSIVEEEVATLRRLVGEFSSFAKLPEAELAQADLADFVRDSEPTLRAATDVDGAIEVRFELPTRAVPVRIDSMMLRRCLDNLVRNAAQAIRSGSGKGRIVVAVAEQGSRAMLEVRDSGPGVPAEDRDRIFDPYFTTKSEGTGLGLAIAKKVVLEHGGTIEYHAAKEGGASFRILLPAGGRQNDAP